MEAPDSFTQHPVFILSPTARSGTNMLAHLLVELGPLQFPPEDRLIGEDFLLKHAHLLEEYSRVTSREWSTWVPDEADLHRRQRLLLESIGLGLLNFISGGAVKDQRLLLKTPGITNIFLFTSLFPRAKLLILVRDGRDVVESSAKAWPFKSYEYWMQEWAFGARLVNDFIETSGKDSRGRVWELVRYEDLVEDAARVVKNVLAFLGLPEDKFQWEKLKHLPIYGSSFLCPQVEGEFHWQITAKPENFNPVGRWRSWNTELRQKFISLAGPELIRLNYVTDHLWAF